MSRTRRWASIAIIAIVIGLVGTLTGEEKNASALVADMDRRIEEIKNKTCDVKRPKVAHITWHAPIWVTGSGTVQDELIEIAGGENVFSDYSHSSNKLQLINHESSRD